MLLVWGCFCVSKTIIPEAQEHFLTPSARRDTHLVGGFGLIELSFKVTDLFLPDMPSIENSNNEFVNAINVLFQIDHLPYRLTPMVYRYGDHNQSGWSVGNITEYPEAIIYEEELTHNEAVLPALHALMDPRFASENSEFREALNDYQDGRYGDCIRNCCNSLESTIKAIHKANNWSVVRWTRQPPSTNLLSHYSTTLPSHNGSSNR